MLTDKTKRNINFDLEEQGKKTSKLGDQRRKPRIRWATETSKYSFSWKKLHKSLGPS